MTQKRQLSAPVRHACRPCIRVNSIGVFQGPCDFCDLAPMGEHCVDCRFYIHDADPEFSKVVGDHFWELV